MAVELCPRCGAELRQIWYVRVESGGLLALDERVGGEADVWACVECGEIPGAPVAPAASEKLRFVEEAIEFSYHPNYLGMSAALFIDEGVFSQFICPRRT